MKARDLGRPEVSSVCHANQKYEGSEHVGIAQAGVACVFLLDLPILLQHGFHLGCDCSLRDVGQRLFVVQS